MSRGGNLRPYRPAAVDPGIPPQAPGQVTPEYPWNMPARSLLTGIMNANGTPRVTGVHGFITFPASFDNDATRPDYWDANRIPPGSGANAAYGGESRYRKFFPGARTGTTHFEIQNYVTEVEWMAKAGFDLFFPDVLQANRPTGDTTRWVQVMGGLIERSTQLQQMQCKGSGFPAV